MSNYFFCYSPNVKARLLKEGFRYICEGLNSRTKKPFWLFERSDDLHAVLNEWSENAK